MVRDAREPDMEGFVEVSRRFFAIRQGMQYGVSSSAADFGERATVISFAHSFERRGTYSILLHPSQKPLANVEERTEILLIFHALQKA